MASIHRAAALAALLLPTLTAAQAPAAPPPGPAAPVRWRAHPDLRARLAGIRTVGILPPDVKVYELTASNDPVLRPDWSDQAREAVTAGLEEALRARGLTAKRLGPPAPGREEGLRDVLALYDAVEDAVLQATYLYRFPAKVERFEYGVGDLSALLDEAQVDAIVFTMGTGANSSGGRQVLQSISAVLAGAYSTGIDRLRVGVVDRTGTLLWFGLHADTGSDLHDPGSAKKFVGHLTDGLPAVTP